ncbi:MAG TPA: aldo/keto reductase [Candidatus Binataceae bacterium]|nr:aldo/keto reductase [Candidatus Binataceae bacterium]
MQKDEQESIRIIRTALDGGINFLDNCWDYNEGQSEIRMGKALRDGYRKKAFLMTKIDGQTKATAAGQIEDCLRRLQTDTIDLMQFHEVIRMDDPEKIFAPGGSFEATIEAQQAGKIRYIGFTGHKSPQAHLHMLETWLAHGSKPASAQMPLNIMDAHFNSFAAQVVPELVKHNIGVLGMKPMGAGVFLKHGIATPTEYLHFAMNLPTSVVITGCESVAQVQQAIDAANGFKPLSSEEAASIVARAAGLNEGGRAEGYKSTTAYDGTTHFPHWLD